MRLIVLLTVALALRLGFVFGGLPAIERQLALRYDADGYTAIAESIWRGEWRDIERGPVYPLFVAVCGGSLTAIRVLQALLDTATVLLVLRIGHRLWDSRIGLVAAWLYAIYPLAWWRVGFVNKEIVLTFLLAVTVYFWQRPACSGVALGLVNLCKPSYLLLPLLRFGKSAATNPKAEGRGPNSDFGFWISSFLRPSGFDLRPFLIMLAVIAPWTVRNFVVSGELVPVGTERGGFTAYVTNWWPTRGDWETNKEQWRGELDRIRGEHAGLNAVQMDRVFYRLTIRNILAEPGHAAQMLARKAFMFWFVNASGRVWWAVALLQLVYVGLAFVGAVQRRPPAVLLTVVLYTWAIHTLVIADVRFALPVMPCVCLMAAWAFRYEGKPLV